MTEAIAEKPDHLTDEEWGAWKEGEAEAVADEGAAPASEEKPAEEKQPDEKPAEAATPTSEPAKPNPLLVANAPENADATLLLIQEQKDELADKFENGEYSVRDYQTELDKLNKQERQVELDLHKAQIANEMSQQQLRNAFLADASAFMAGTIYEKSVVAFNALDAAVIEAAKDPASANLSNQQIMEKAHAQVMKDPLLAMAFSGAAPKPDTKQPAKPAASKPQPPLTLAHVPAAEINSSEGRFAVIDKISDPEQLQAAIAKLPPQERDAYLRGAA